MVQRSASGYPSYELKQNTRQKEINPFSEQEKHGDGTQGLEPENTEEYQGNPSVQRGDHAIEDDSEGERKRA